MSEGRFPSITRMQWRNMTSSELEILQAGLAMRQQMKRENPEELSKLRDPDPALYTIEGAFHWAIAILWQDQRLLLIIGGLAIAGHILVGLWKIGRWLVG